MGGEGWRGEPLARRAAPRSRRRSKKRRRAFAPGDVHGHGLGSRSLPDGTPVGTTSGAPTVIPAGYYTIHLSGLERRRRHALLHLTGPAVNVFENMNEGGVGSLTDNAYFMPLATYTWTNDSLPGVVYTFTASSVVLGTPPTTPVSPKAGAPAASPVDIGSDSEPCSARSKAG